MKNIFITLFLLLPILAFGQSIQRNQLTTNTNPGNTVSVTLTNSGNLFSGSFTNISSITASNLIVVNPPTINGSGITNLTYTFEFTTDGGSSAVTTGVKDTIRIPRNGTITGAYLWADQAGSAGVDLWKTNYTAYTNTGPATVSGSITGATHPAFAGKCGMFNTALTDWTNTFSAGDCFTMNVISNATCQRLTLQITYVNR